MSTHPNHKSFAVQIGDHISDWTSKLFAHPYMQVGVILFCVVWFVAGRHVAQRVRVIVDGFDLFDRRD